MVEFAPLRFFRNLSRVREIARVLLKHGFGDVVEQLHLAGWLRWVWRSRRGKASEDEHLTRPQRLRRVLEDLGPSYIKFGQVMSTRSDLLPAAYIAALEQLQENVPPFSGELAVQLIEQQLGGRVESLFAEFDRTPLAAGSLGQVHRARHLDGTPLAVKLRRPNAVHDVEADLSLMRQLALLMERHVPGIEVFDPVGLVQQFGRSVRRELSFTREARTMEEFRRLFRNDATLAIPRVYFDLCTDSVLCMEYIDGWKPTDFEQLRVAKVDPTAVAENGARIFMKMAFQFGVFHGDPHPGNIRVLPSGVISLLDYGMVGRLEEDKRDLLIDLLLAVTRHDPRQAVDQVLLLGKPSRPIERSVLTGDVRDFIDSYYGIPLDQLDVGRLLSDFTQILSSHGIRLPSDLMLLIRAIVTLEGVGRTLDGDFNLARPLAPFIEEQVRDRYHPKRLAGRLFDETETLLRQLHSLPGLTSRALEKFATGELTVQLEHRNLEHVVTEIDRSSNRITIGVVMSALILASAIVLRTESPGGLWIAAPTFVLSSLLGVWLIYGVFRSGRL